MSFQLTPKARARSGSLRPSFSSSMIQISMLCEVPSFNQRFGILQMLVVVHIAQMAAPTTSAPQKALSCPGLLPVEILLDMFPVVNMLWVFHDPLFHVRCMYLIAAFPAANSFVFTCSVSLPTATLNNASVVARLTKQRHPDVLPSCTFLARID